MRACGCVFVFIDYCDCVIMKIEDPFGLLYVIIHAAAAATSGCFDMNYLKMGAKMGHGGSPHTAGKHSLCCCALDERHTLTGCYTYRLKEHSSTATSTMMWVNERSAVCFLQTLWI